MKGLLLLLGFLSFQTTFSQDFPTIQEQLEQIQLQNMELRGQVMPTIRKYGMESPEMDSLNQVIQKFDDEALELVIAIIDKYGWLSKKQVGQTANGALFLAIQHAPDNEIRKKYFPLLEASANKGDSELFAMATMKDRILVQDGKSQIYGTQSRMVGGVLKPYPISDPKNVNKRRRKVGLGKLK